MPGPMPPPHEPLPALATARAAWAMLRIGAAAALAGPTVLLGRALFFLLVMLVLSSFWGLVGAERVAGLVTELPPHGLMFYVGVTEWITLSVPAVHLRLEDDLRRGGIDVLLARRLLTWRGSGDTPQRKKCRCDSKRAIHDGDLTGSTARGSSQRATPRSGGNANAPARAAFRRSA